MNHPAYLRIYLLALLTFSTANLSALADQTWTGASDNQWSNVGNWSGGAVPGPADVVIYNGSSTANLSNWLAGPFGIQGLVFGNVPANITPSGGAIIAGSTLTNGASGIDMSLASTNLTISAPFAINGDQSWTVAPTPGLTLSGVVSGSGNLSVAAGGGGVLLKSANTFSGTVALNSGSIYAYAPLALSTSMVTVASGARVYYLAGAQTAAIPTPFTLNGSSALRVGNAIGITLSSNITLASSSTIQADTSSTYTMNGSISGNNVNLTCNMDGNVTNKINGALSLGSGSLTKSSTTTGSTLRLTNPGNSWGGGTTIGNGTLQIGDGSINGVLPGNVTITAGLLDFITATNTSQTFAGTISGAGGLYKDGLGTLYLTGTNSFSGSITNNAGPLWFNGSTNFGAGTKTLSVANNLLGAGVHLNGTNGNIVFPSTMTWFASQNQGTVFNEAGDNVIAGTINLTTGGGDAYMIVNAGTLTLKGNLQNNVSARNMRIGGAGNGIITGPMISGGFRLLKQDAGTWTIASNSVSPSYGSVVVAGTNNSGPVTTSTLVVNGQLQNATAPVTVQSNAWLQGFGVIKGPTTIQAGGTLALGSDFGTFSISNTLTLSGTNIMKIGKSGGAFTNDLIQGMTTLNFGGTLTVLPVGTDWAGANSFQLFTAGSFSGAFTATNLPALPSGLSWDTSNLGNGILAISAPLQPSFSRPVLLSDGNIQLTFSYPGGSGFDYRLWASTNAALSPITSTWTLLSSGTFFGFDVTYTDLDATNYPRRFYSISMP
jgi:fibronectin-binding autotransporter adhesin